MDYKLEDLIPVGEFSQEYTDALFALCERFYSVGRYDDAKTLAYELCRISPLDVRMYKLSAAIEAGKCNYMGAFSCYSRGLEIAPNDPELWIGMGQAGIHLGHIADAALYLDKVLELTHKDPVLHDHARRLRNLIQ